MLVDFTGVPGFEVAIDWLVSIETATFGGSK